MEEAEWKELISDVERILIDESSDFIEVNEMIMVMEIARECERRKNGTVKRDTSEVLSVGNDGTN
jgi:hypothetical protein